VKNWESKFKGPLTYYVVRGLGQGYFSTGGTGGGGTNAGGILKNVDQRRRGGGQKILGQEGKTNGGH